MRPETRGRLRLASVFPLALLLVAATFPRHLPEDRPPPPDLTAAKFSLAPSVWIPLLPAPLTPSDFQVEAGRPRLSYPLKAPLTQPFGCTDFELEPITRTCGGFHFGIDLAAPNLTPIQAAADGIAYPFADTELYGNHVVIQHRAGLSTLYGHMTRFTVGWGQAVNEGQVIGYEGSTGNSTGPHLHFEVRFAGAALDPIPFLEGSPPDPYPLPLGWPGMPEVSQQDRF